MNKFEFLKYEPTPNEKHLGIATVIIKGCTVIAKFKIVPTKEGNNSFPAPASFKIGEQYVDSLALDSKMEDTELKDLIREKVKLASGNNISKPIETTPVSYQLPEYDPMMF